MYLFVTLLLCILEPYFHLFEKAVDKPVIGLSQGFVVIILFCMNAGKDLAPCGFVKTDNLGGIFLRCIQVGPILGFNEARHLARIPFSLGIAKYGGGFAGMSVQDVPFLMVMIQGVPLLVVNLVVKGNLGHSLRLGLSIICEAKLVRVRLFL